MFCKEITLFVEAVWIIKQINIYNKIKVNINILKIYTSAKHSYSK